MPAVTSDNTINGNALNGNALNARRTDARLMYARNHRGPGNGILTHARSAATPSTAGTPDRVNARTRQVMHT